MKKLVKVKYKGNDIHEQRFVRNGIEYVTSGHVVEVNDDIAKWLTENPKWETSYGFSKKKKKEDE